MGKQRGISQIHESSDHSFLHLVTGGSGSGKSAYAENCVLAAASFGGISCKNNRAAATADEGIYGKNSDPAVSSDRGISVHSRRIYIATMIPYGEDGRQRVERHRRLRAKKNFETMECYTGLERLSLSDTAHKTEDAAETAAENANVVLLECMSNLVANEMFEEGGAGEDTVAAILRGIEGLLRQARHIVVVTNEVFSDGMTYDAGTMRYLSYLGEVNRTIADWADQVTEVVYGIPVNVKKVSGGRA